MRTKLQKTGLTHEAHVQEIAVKAGPFCCKKCAKTFRTKSGLQSHKHGKKKTTKSHECDVCNEVFSTKTALTDHQQTTHKLFEPILENPAGKSTQKPNHKKIGKREKQRKTECDVCCAVFKAPHLLRKHQITHTDEKPFACDQCQFTTAHQWALIEHTRRIHQKVEKNFECEICKNKFAWKNDLKAHVKHVHEKKTMLECLTCAKVFTTNYQLQVHGRTHTGEKPFACEQCDFTCTQRSNMKTHIQGKHGKRTFECDICAARFRTTWSRTAHIRRIHEKVRSHECEVCAAVFHTTGELKQHLRTHTGEKPFACDQCHYKSSFQNMMKRHIDAMHGAQTPTHKCDICKKAFKTHVYLYMHKHFTHGPRRHACKFCDYRAPTNARLQVHYRGKHKTESKI